MEVRQLIKLLIKYKLDADLSFEVKSRDPEGKVQLDELNFDKLRKDKEGFIWLTLEN